VVAAMVLEVTAVAEKETVAVGAVGKEGLVVK
jgi:hypothetical protein